MAKANALPTMEGLIFDLDGTLADTLPDIATAINLTRTRFQLEPLPEPEIVRHVGNGSAHLVRQTVPVEEDAFEAAHEAYGAFYREHMLDRTCLHAGVADILERFRERRLAVITNKPLDQTEQLLTGLAVRGYFAMVLGGDSLPRRKPDPLPIRHFLQAEGLAPERVLIVGDGVNDVRAGKAAGITTVAVTYGVATREELAAEGPDFTIERLPDLLRIIS